MICRPDKYDTIQLIALLQQLLTHGGYYNSDLEFINLERVQVTGPARFLFSHWDLLST